MSEPPTNDKAGAGALAAGRIALRLLELQQRLDAWDRLCNEEFLALRTELTELKTDYLQQCQVQRRTARWKGRRKTLTPS
jgi:hypothetical protein